LKETTYEQLISKLNAYIQNDGVDPSVSPTLGSGYKPGPLFITGDMDVESLTDNELLLVHTKLHAFYSNGGGKNLTKTDIEQLHEKVAEKIQHVEFDKLDKK
jgi:hypothetical protein